jgi:hypothetical protein
MNAAAVFVALSLLAAEDPEEAKKCFEAGRTAYEQGYYSIAVTAFGEAYKLSPRPPVIFSYAQAERQQYFVDRDGKRLSHARELFQEYLASTPKGGRSDHARQHLADIEELLKQLPQAPLKVEERIEVKAKTQLMITSRTSGALAAIGDEEPSELPQIRDVVPGKHRVRVEANGYTTEELESVAVEGRLVVLDFNLKEKPAVLVVSAPAGSDVSLDGRLIGEAPLTAPIEVVPGRHLIAVTQRGSYGFMRDLVLERAQRLPIEAQLETTTQRTVSYVFLGAAAALVAGGGVTGGIALISENRAQDIDERRLGRFGLSAEDLASYERNVDRRDTFAPPAMVLLGVGATAAITGALLYFIDSPRIEPR